MLLDVFGQGMHLKRQVPSAHRIEKVKADGKFWPETLVNLVTEQCDRFAPDEVQAGQFNALLAEVEHQAILLRHTIKAPAIIGCAAVQIKNFLHPLSAPRGRIEKRHDTKWASGCVA